ncbi:MAG: methyltransferase [Paludibaculum sp.]
MAPTTSRQRLRDALAHRQPDRIPIDFGGSAVTGVHVSCVATLRDYYGLEKRPVKVHEPYQMLGLVESDLSEAMGLDVTGVFPRNTMFGFANAEWKEWDFRGLPVLVSTEFRTRTEANGDILIYPEGDETVAPSGRMPLGSAFFDTIVRQPPFDEDSLNIEDNLEEFTPLSEADLDHISAGVAAAQHTGKGILATFGGTAFGDIALVPAPFLKNPKGIRDVAEWYMSTSSRKDYVHKIFAHQCENGIRNLERVHARIGDAVDAVFLCGTDFGTQTSQFCSVRTLRELWFPYYKAVNDWVHRNTGWKCFKHSCGSVEKFFDAFIGAGFDIINPVQCSGRGHGSGDSESEIRRPPGVLGRRSGHPENPAIWNTRAGARRGAAPLRDLLHWRRVRFRFNPQCAGRHPVENLVAMLDAVKEFNGR